MLPEPGAQADPAALVADYLAFYRSSAVAKVRSLTAGDLRRSRLPSGWTPLELVRHLAFMEQRWLVWGFLAEPVPDPWGDHRDDRWWVAEDVTLDQAVAHLNQVAARTRAVLADHPLTEQGRTGGRFTQDPPTLAGICFHVLQEYARHVGHLDVAVELAGGHVGEDDDGQPGV